MLLRSSALVVAAPSLLLRGYNMKAIIRTFPLLLVSLLLSTGAHAGWVCGEPFMSTTNPQECKAAGSQQTPEALATAYIKEIEKKNPSRAPYALTECTPSGKEYSCRYTFYIGSSQFSNTVAAAQDASASCPETLESRSDNVGVTKAGDKYFVLFSVGSVTDDICHNSCSYLASSASISTCYRVTGSTDTGFCNFVVGLNSASPSCTSESGYKAPATGDSLSGGTGTGGGGDDGGDSGTGGDGGSGGDGGTGGSGGDGDSDGSDGSGGDTEPDFVAPGKLNAKDVLEDEKNQLKYQQFVTTLETSFNDSGFGSAVNQLKQTLLTTGVGAACPTPVIELSFVTVVISSHCDIYNNSDLAAIFTTVFMAGWGLLSLRIVLSA